MNIEADRRFLVGYGLLTILLLLLALAPMPYGFYMLVRIATCGFFVLAALRLKASGRITQTIVAALIALLFNPFAKIALGRDLWAVADVAAALAAGMFILKQDRPPEENRPFR